MNEIECSFFYCAQSLKSDMYFALTAYPQFKYSVAVCDLWLLYWTVCSELWKK